MTLFANRITRSSASTTPTIDLSKYAAPSEDLSGDETNAAEDNYDEIVWKWLSDLRQPSHISKEGQLDIKIRVSLSKSRKNPDQIIWVCQYYSTIINATLLKVGGKALYNITNATSTAPLI
jgi:hypothetical protein